MTETQIQEQIYQYLVYCNWLVLRVNGGGMKQTSKGKERYIPFNSWQCLGQARQSGGIADLVACSPNGDFIALEVKKSKGRATQAQQEFLQEVRERGGIAKVVRSLEDVKKIVEEL